MKWYVPRPSSTLDAGQLVYMLTDERRRYYKLSLSLFLLPAATAALTPSYSTARQCSPFNVTLEESNITTGRPPVPVIILPFDARPGILKLLNVSDNTTTNTQEYTLNKLPLKSGSQFIVITGDGDGAFFSRPIHIIQGAHTTILVYHFSKVEVLWAYP